VHPLDGATGGVRKRSLELGSDIPGGANRGQQPLARVGEERDCRWTPIIEAAPPMGGNALFTSLEQ
jgi:hypothetical protein